MSEMIWIGFEFWLLAFAESDMSLTVMDMLKSSPHQHSKDTRSKISYIRVEYVFSVVESSVLSTAELNS